jgi:succinoglycan biosynthesis protein ExoM
MHVAICVATCRRPVMLAALLESLRTAIDAATNINCTVVIVDNDAASSARTVVEQFRNVFPHVRYAVVPIRNIARARNHAVHLAIAANVDWVAFVDDDCTVADDWLTQLLSTAASSHADVVWGRRRFLLPDATPAWMKNGPLFRSFQHETGAVMATAESNNVLISRRIAEDISFDERFGLAGGSDSLFFLRARLAGARIVWANDAVVTETVPATRTSPRWVLTRAFRAGNCGVFVYRAALPVHRWVPGRVAKGIGHFVWGGLLALIGTFRGRAAMLAGIERSALGVGIFAALAGYRYVEYRDVHGG